MLVHVVGAGAAATALARALHGQGWTIGDVVCRTIERARARSELIGAGVPTAYAEHLRDTATDDAPVLLLVGVPDRQIATVAAELAARRRPAGSVALHLSGSVPVDALQPLRDAGCAVGGLHPLKSFVDPQSDAASLAGTVAALDGDDAARQAGAAIAEALQLTTFTLAPGARAAWHGAATHAANHLVALVDQCLDLMERAGLDRETARAALLPLMAGTLANLARHPPGAALTGPVVRGDVSVVEGHLAALRDVSSDVGAAYRTLANRALHLARHERSLDPELADRLAALLAEPPP